LDQLRELLVNVEDYWFESLRLSHPHELYEAVGEDPNSVFFVKRVPERVFNQWK